MINSEIVGAVFACIAVLALGGTAAYFSLCAWRWPRIQATIVGHEVLNSLNPDDAVKVTFTDQNANQIEAILRDDTDMGKAFFKDKPVGGVIEISYNPKKSTQIIRPRGPLPLIFVTLFMLTLIFQLVSWVILPRI